MFGFCRRDCAVVVTVYHSHLPLLFYFQVKNVTKKKHTSEVWNFEKQAVHFSEYGLCGGFASSGCATVFTCRTFPQPAYTTTQLRPHNPPTLSYRGYKYHAGPQLNLQEAALTQRGGQGASGWKLRGIFYVRETTEHRAEGRHRSLTGSCGVLDWKHSLILPAAPGHSCFKCSRTKQTKMAQLLPGRTANVHRQEMRLRWESSSLLMAWAVAAGHYQQVKLALSAASLCRFSANKEALAYLAFVSSMGLCR